MVMPDDDVIDIGRGGVIDLDELESKQQAKLKSKSNVKTPDYFRKWETYDAEKAADEIDKQDSPQHNKVSRKKKQASEADNQSANPRAQSKAPEFNADQLKQVAQECGLNPDLLRICSQALCFTDQQVNGLSGQAYQRVQSLRFGPEFAKYRAAAEDKLGLDHMIKMAKQQSQQAAKAKEVQKQKERQKVNSRKNTKGKNKAKSAKGSTPQGTAPVARKPKKYVYADTSRTQSELAEAEAKAAHAKAPKVPDLSDAEAKLLAQAARLEVPADLLVACAHTLALSEEQVQSMDGEAKKKSKQCVRVCTFKRFAK